MIEETTAKAFEALLHFLYSDALEVEGEFLVDVLRCSCCVRVSALVLARCALSTFVADPAFGVQACRSVPK